MNIYVIPRLSPYGAYKSQRQVYLTSSTTTDPNRDFLRLRTAETQARMVAYNLFEPEVVLDGHEYQESLTSTSHKRKDLMLCTHWMPNHDDTYKQTALDLAYAAFDQLTADGLYYSWYSDSVGGLGANTGSSNTAFRSSLHILMETSGINQGLLQYERRVATHNSAMTGIFAYLDANAAAVKKTVHENRQQYIENGKTYREDDIVILDATTSDHKELNIQGKMVNLYNGTLTDTTYPAYVPDVINRFRIAPTAYVIPAEESFTEKVLSLMDKHGIAYTFIPAGSTLPLQQYTGTVTEAFLTEERATYFANGAYVFTMDQVDGYILANLMEPDVNDTATDKGTLVQQGIITAENDVFPIYRYIRDLNEDDFVDYTVTQAPVIHTTVYLDGTNGLDTNDGMSEATAVKTMEQAYAVMAANVAAGGAGSTGTLVIIGMYELGAARYNMPAASFPVTITGKTGTDGLSFTGGTGDNQRDLELHGETTFRGLTLHTNNTTTSNRLFCNGHKVVFDTGITSTTKASKSSGNFSVYGGGFDYAHMAETVDLTIRSGIYSYVYGGGHRGSVSGQVKVVITGGRVVNNIMAAYTGNVGSYRLEISNIKVGGAIYAGTYTRNTPKKIGTVQNGATLVIGKGVTVTNVYCSARAYGDVKKFSLVIADGIDLSTINVKKVYPDQNPGQLTENPTLQLMQDVTKNVTLYEGVTLDLNGHSITGNITVDGTLEVKDSQTDDYTVADGVYGQITGTVTGTLEAADGYVAIDGTSFHRFEQKISGVSIRPSIAGIYYNATWLCDEVVAGKIASYGVAVSLVDMPDATFNTTDTDSLWTAFDKTSFVSGQAQTSVMIANILKTNKDNESRGKASIYAAPYVILEDGTKLVATTEVSYSLYQVMQKAEETAFEANAEKLNAFYAAWESVMKDWGFTKIGK